MQAGEDMQKKQFQGNARTSIATRRWRYCVARERSAVGRFAERMQRDLEDAGISAKSRQTLGVVIDELLANVIMHARDARGPVHLRIRYAQGVLVARMRHFAAAFDSTLTNDEGVAQSLAHATIGGAGLRIVRAMTRDFRYRHHRGQNHLRLEMLTASEGS